MKISELLNNKPHGTIAVLSQEEIDIVLNGLKSKGIEKATCLVALDYLACNKIAFGNILNTKEVAQRIAQNLDKDIKFMSVFSKYKYGFEAIFSSATKSVEVSPRLNTILSNRGRLAKKCYVRSILLHEFDHCSSCHKQTMPGNEILNAYYKKFPSTKPQKIKSLIEPTLKYSCGFFNPRTYVEGGLFAGIDLTPLEEGVTVYKQKKYDKICGYKNKLADDYEFYFQVVNHIAKMVGEETLIKNHFYGNYKAVREAYMKKTKTDLNAIVNGLSTYEGLGDYKEEKQETKKLIMDLIGKIEILNAIQTKAKSCENKGEEELER